MRDHRRNSKSYIYNPHNLNRFEYRHFVHISTERAEPVWRQVEKDIERQLFELGYDIMAAYKYRLSTDEDGDVWAEVNLVEREYYA